MGRRKQGTGGRQRAGRKMGEWAGQGKGAEKREEPGEGDGAREARGKRERGKVAAMACGLGELGWLFGGGLGDGLDCCWPGFLAWLGRRAPPAAAGQGHPRTVNSTVNAMFFKEFT